MKKIIPFKKDIIFKTNISEITSISLEHTLQVEEDNTISGNFIVSGDYKLTDTSNNTEPFYYELPFLVTMDERYVLDNIFIDIDDFYYEIINENVLSVNIEVLVDKLDEILIKKEETIDLEEMFEDELEEEILMEIETDERCIEKEDETPSNITSLFDSMDDNYETFKSYVVYILREGDTIESVMEKYKVTKEELLDYNDLSEIKIGDKIIIPSNDND